MKTILPILRSIGIGTMVAVTGLGVYWGIWMIVGRL